MQSSDLTTATLQQWLALAVGVLLAILVGYGVAIRADFMLLGALGLVVVMAIVTGLRDRAWLLILLGWPIAGYTRLLPIPLSIRDNCVGLAALSWLAYRIISQEQRRIPWHTLDLLVGLNIAYLGITFLRHPVGFHASGSDMIGGKNYFNVAIAVVAYFVLLHSPSRWRTVSRIPLVILAGSTAVTLLFAVSYFLPGLRDHLILLYAAIDVSAYFAAVGRDTTEMPRFGALATFGMNMMLVLCAYYPSHTLFHPGRRRFWLFLLTWVCTLLSGFRSYVLWNIAAIGIGSWLRQGWRQLVPVGLISAVFLFFLLVGQGRLYELPPPAQRALSFLPGQWSADVVENAKASSQGRFEHWIHIIRDGLLHDWLLGGGFGFEARALKGVKALDFYEGMTLTGGFHNGPLSTIAYVGVVGLILLYWLMIQTAREAVRCVKACQDTPLLPVAIFVAVQCIYGPIAYTFVFGGYDSHLPNFLLLVGLVRLVGMKRTELETAVTTPAGRPQPATGRS